MTREEAIEILQEEHDWVQEPCYVIKAIEIAISALTPPTQEQMERVKREMDATVEGLRVCSIENNMECQYCLYRTARSFCWNCEDGSNWKFRGQKED